MKKLFILIIAVFFAIPISTFAQSNYDFDKSIKQAKEYYDILKKGSATNAQHETIIKFIDSNICSMSAAIQHGPKKIDEADHKNVHIMFGYLNDIMKQLSKLKLNAQNRSHFNDLGLSWTNFTSTYNVYKEREKNLANNAQSPQASEPVTPAAQVQTSTPAPVQTTPAAPVQDVASTPAVSIADDMVSAAAVNTYRAISGDLYITSDVDTNPLYPGGETALNGYLASKLTNYPEDARIAGKSGRVIVAFTITEDGSACNPIILKGVFPNLDRMALEIVNNMEKWAPARKSSVPVNCTYVLPIDFRLP